MPGEQFVTDEQGRYVDGERKLLRRVELRVSAEQKDAIYKAVLDSSHIDIEYTSLLTLAGLIALFGLLENSSAVIIGAMLISPLMNPILSAALALLLGDGNLGKRSATVLALSIAGVIGITCLVAFLIPLKQATPQILARTTPNLLDLFIAFLSGLAGTLALRGGSVAATILPGVAIAVAVVPPLSVVGYGLSTGQGSIAGGAFLLFFTNLVSIIISAAAVFRIMGFQPHREAEQGRWKLKYRLGISALVLVFLSIPLFLTLRKAAIEVAIRSSLQRELKTAFATEDASVSDLTFSRMHNGLQIDATLQTTRYVETKTIDSVEDDLRQKFGPDTKLLVDQVLVTHGGVPAVQAARAQNPILGGVVKQVEEKAPFDFKSSSSQSLEYVQSEVDSVLAGTRIQREAAPEIDLGPTKPLVLRLQLAAPEPLTGQTISLLNSQLGSKLGLPVQIHGQVEVKGPSFQFALISAKPTSALNADERGAVNNVIKQAQVNDLRLQITCPHDQPAAGGSATPRFVAELQRLLSLSGLKNSQWTIGVQPSGSKATVAGKGTTSPSDSGMGSQGVVTGQVGCDLKAFQDF